MATLEELITQIAQRQEALGDLVSETRIRELVNTAFQSLTNDKEFVRKMRFGGGHDARLLGTKYYRWGLTLADVEWLYDFQNSIRGIAKASGGVYTGPSETLENTFRALSEAYYLPDAQVREMDRQAIDDMFPRIPLSWFPASEREMVKRGGWSETRAYRDAVRAMDTSESGYGSQLIGAEYVGTLWDAARHESRVFNLLDSFEMTAPTVYLPVEVDIPEMTFVSENTGPTDSAYTTVKTGSQRVTVSAKKFAINQIWSGELEEDSIIPFVPFLRRQQQLSTAHYSDALVLNGDTTNAGTGNINLDDADPADTKYYLAFDGIRHAGLVDNTNNRQDVGGALTYDHLIKCRQRMKDTSTMINVHWGKPTDPNDLIHVAEDATADAISLLGEVLTVDKYGNQATVINGEVAKIGRSPLITSLALSLTEADGKVSTTANNNTKGVVVTFNRRAFKVGWRRRVQTTVSRLQGRDQMLIETYLRMGFGRFTPTGAASGIEAADVMYDITV